MYWTDEKIISSPSFAKISNSPWSLVIVDIWEVLFITLAAGTSIFLYITLPWISSLSWEKLNWIRVSKKNIFLNLFSLDNILGLIVYLLLHFALVLLTYFLIYFLMGFDEEDKELINSFKTKLI